MKRILTVALAVMLLLPAVGTSTDKVYVCTGTYATKYHKIKDCDGLRNCKGEVKEVSLAEANRMNRTPCQLCCK